MGNTAFLMFLSHKYNTYSNHKHATCPGRRQNDPPDNKLDHCPFLKVRKKRKFKNAEKVICPQCCYFLLLYGCMRCKRVRINLKETTHINPLYLHQQALKAKFYIHVYTKISGKQLLLGKNSK